MMRQGRFYILAAILAIFLLGCGDSPPQTDPNGKFNLGTHVICTVGETEIRGIVVWRYNTGCKIQYVDKNGVIQEIFARDWQLKMYYEN